MPYPHVIGVRYHVYRIKIIELVAGISDLEYSFFVPKYIAAVDGGQTFIMGADAGFSAVCAKYLYIYDRKIDGHATNTASGTNNGITFDNSQFVLRYVIGV